MSEKHCNHCGTANKEEDSFAMTLVKEYSKTSRRWFVACMVILAMWLVTIAGFLIYLNQYDFSSYTIEQDGEGINNYIGEDGIINNGAEDNNP